MVLMDQVIVKLLSSRAGVAFIESLWLCNEYQQQHQEAFQALTSILTRGKYTSSPKAWLHRRGVVAIFAQLAAVDLDLDPVPQRGAKNEDNPVNAPVNVSKHSLVKARIPSRVSPLSLARGMAELGERWKLMEADDIMSVALVIQSVSKDGLIGKEEFLEFAERIGTLSRTMEYKNNPSDALEKLYSDMVEKKRESAAAEFFAEWLNEDTSSAAVSGDDNMSDSGGASGGSGNFFYGAEGSKFYKNARTLKTIQYQLEEMCAQARANGMKPLISLEQLKKKVKERGLAGGSSGSGTGGVPHDILGRFLEGMGASVSAREGERERGQKREGGGGSTAATATVERGSSSSSPYSFFSGLMGSSTGGGEHVSLLGATAGSDHIYTDGGGSTTHGAIQSPNSTLPTFRFEEYTASEGDAGAALRELRNNSAFLAQRMAAQAQSGEFEAALRQFQSLGRGGSHAPPDGDAGGYIDPPGVGGVGVEGGGLSTVFTSIDAGSPSRPSNAAIITTNTTNTTNNAAAITANGTPVTHPSDEELDIAQRLKGLTVDTSWDRTRGAVVMSPMTEASSTPRHSPRSSSVSVAANGLLASASTPRSSSGRSSGSTLDNSAASTSSNTAASEKKANLSIFKSPRLKTRVALRKSPSDRLPVRVSPCHGSGPASKPVVTRAQKNKDAAESAIVNKKSFKH